MEKARRSKERESAMFRVHNIDTRFHEIEAEKEEILKATGIRVAGNEEVDPANRPKPAHGHNNKGGFKISY